MNEGKTLADRLKAAAEDDDPNNLRRLTSKVRELTSERDRLKAQLSLIERVSEARVKPPKWLAPRDADTEHRVIASLLLSDLHLDEVVFPEEVRGCNAYNREIAEIRLRRTVEKAVAMRRRYLRDYTYEGIVVFLGGDTFSGDMHEELKESNEATICESLLHWLGPMEAALGMLADEFKKVRVLGVPGNHGRRTKKPRFKGRAADNFDWLFAELLARGLKSDRRITFQLTRAADDVVDIYDTTYLLTHGDQFHGGNGISGILTPLALGNHRKTRRQASINEPYDIMLMGHFHQFLLLPGVIVNGSLKGYDEYAFGKNLPFEPPRQAFWLTAQKRGLVVAQAIEPMDRRAEGW